MVHKSVANKSSLAPASPAKSYAMPAIRAIVLVAATTALLAVSARCGTWLTIRRLADQVQAADDTLAPRLVRELAGFEGPAYRALVAAANSPRSAVALTARAEIDRRIEQWQRSARLSPSSFMLPSQVLSLAEAIEEELPELTVSGRRWARGVLSSLLSLSEHQSFNDRFALVQVCDRALSALPSDEINLQFEPDEDYKLTLSAPPEEKFLAAEAPAPGSSVHDPIRSSDRDMQLEPPARPSSNSAAGGESANPAVTIRVQPDGSERHQPPPDALSEWKPQWSKSQAGDIESKRPPAGVPAHSASVARLAPPPQSLEKGLPEVDVSDVLRISDHEERVLFNMLASGSKERQEQAADALLVRGYGHVVPRDARMLTSASPRDRLALVDLVLTSSRLEARKWLWLLAHDKSGEVRAAAIASIATSADSGLIEAALDLSIRDTDPRVAEQASALRQRLR